MNVLRVTDLTVRHARDDVRAVDGVSFEVGANETLGIVGESGCGKTTLALALMGLLPESAQVEGSVRLRGEELLGRSDAELSRVRGKDLAMVFQDPLSALTSVHTVGDQIAEAVRIHSRVKRAVARARAVELLDLVGVPNAVRWARAYPHELSGGMRQRVVIAMAIANSPVAIVADEPTSALDTIVQAQVLDVLRVAKEAAGAAIVLISHDLDVVAGFADRVLAMRAGRAVECGLVGEMYRQPSAPPVRQVAGERCRPVVLAVDALVRHHRPLRKAGTVRAVDGVSFDIGEGETLALVGESGCGKTTTLLEIMRLSRPERGRVVVFGHDTATLRSAHRRALRRDVQIVFQDPHASLDPRMRVASTIAEPLTAHGMPSSQARVRVVELLDLVGLDPDHARRFPHSLSGGEKQRVCIARALALEPRLLLLDEPVSALDVSVRDDVLTLLEGLRERLGLAYLFVSHDLAVVHRMADRIAVMHMGRIVEIGPVDDVYGAPAHPCTRALLDAAPLTQAEPPDAATLLKGCRFRSRCPRYATLTADARPACEVHDPLTRRVDFAEDAGWSVACHHPLIGAGIER
ncbi:ABC transporter ATP-binding protein [Actinomadura meridiana]|uniref:ABC transporter ATP-binding protein n=1 Tax=Actinomadura meridiana TaxID=559626 RepID=A0ABP8BXL6_9ACTN